VLLLLLLLLLCRCCVVCCVAGLQALWYVSSLIHSMHQHKQLIARNILHNASAKLLVPDPAGGDSSAQAAAAAQMLQRSEAFFRELVSLAELQPDDRRIRMPPGLQADFSAFLVPSQAALTICYPPPASSRPCDYFPTDQRFIKSFNRHVEVMATKAKPKKIGLTTTCGLGLQFLLKQEKDGDLRKDEREFI
jgi:hypothetical protein